MTERKLTVMDGGRSLDIRSSNKHFISAYVTDTRLMGVLAVYAHWHLDNLDPEPDGSEVPVWGDLHQFFYIDCEETGIETYHEVRESDLTKVEEVEQMVIGGLGAGKIDLDEDQLRQLMCLYREFNREKGLPLPEGEGHYDFMFSPDMTPDQRQRHDLMEHICPPIKTDFQLINLFLMRCFGTDPEGAGFLTGSDPNIDTSVYDRYIRATFCRNVIDKRDIKDDGSRDYLCESLVEMNGDYDLVVSRITVKDFRVKSLECKSNHHISDTEAALIMRKEEFVTLYEILLSEEELENNIDEFSVGFHTTVSEHENGRLFMSYRPNNDHVDRRIFQLSEDVKGLFFITNNRQLILGAYDAMDVAALEILIRKSVLAPYLIPTSRYKFIEPVLYEFINSDIESFEAYLSMIREGGID